MTQISLELLTILTSSGAITLMGIAIVYFGNLILKSRRELCKDKTSQILEGTIFLLNYLLIPILIIYNVTNNLEFFRTISWVILLFVQYGFIILLRIQMSYRQKIFNYLNWIMVVLSFLINYYFINQNNFINLIVSILLSFLILTLTSVVYGSNIEKPNYNSLIKNLPYKKIIIEKVNNKSKGEKRYFEEIEAQIIKLGDEFIEIHKKGESDNKTFLLNKSKINSIEN